MRRYVVRRTAAALLALWLASIFVFAGVRALPGDFVTLHAAAVEDATEETLDAIRARYGIDQPMHIQYIRWVGRVVQGDFGRSSHYRSAVTPVILEKLPVTIYLGLASVGLASLIGVASGVIAAARRNRLADYLANLIALIGLSVPNFWLGLLLILLFAVSLGWLPSSGYVPFFENPVTSIRHMAMPVFVLGTALSAVLLRQTRSSMLETLDSNYVRTARAKGLSEVSVIGKHALRNALLTVVTLLGLQVGAVISGTVIIERVFLIPGFGSLLVSSVQLRDFAVVQAIALITAAGYIIVNWIVDIVYSVLDPRIRIAEGAAR